MSRRPTFRPADFFVIRSPLLEDRSPEMMRPEELAGDGIVREALRSASKSLAALLDGERVSRVDPWPAFARYVERMRGRSTPFSLLAGYAIGTVGGAETAIVFAPRAEYRRVARLPVSCVLEIVRSLLPADAEAARWIARKDMTILPDVIRVALHPESGAAVTMIQVERSEAVDAALSAAKTPVTLAALTAAVRKFARDDDRARRFVIGMIEAEILISADDSCMSGGNEIDALEQVDGGAPIANAARAIRETRLQTSIEQPLRELQQAIADKLERPEETPLIFDLEKPMTRDVLADDVVASLREIVDVFQRLSPALRDDGLVEFASWFRARYGDREMPLVEALDSSRGFPFPVEPRHRASFTSEQEAALVAWRVHQYGRGLRSPNDEVVLEPSDLPTHTLFALPESFSIRFSLARDPMAIWSPCFERPPGTATFARASGISEGIRAHVTRFLADVAALEPDVDHADVSYVIPGRSHPFAQYPRIQPFELLAPRGEDPTRLLDVNDVVVSVRNDEVRLRSRRSGRWIRPRVTSAANHCRDDFTNLARFLFAVSLQGQIFWRRWSWGDLESAPHLPRVRYKEHVLSPARWRLDPLGDARHAATDRSSRWDLAQRLRARFSMPRYMIHEETDRGEELPIDWEDPWSVEAWLDVVKAHAPIRLREAFPAARSAVSGPEGKFHHEIVVPFLATEVRAPRAPIEFHAANDEVTNDLEIPGGRVLCLRLCGDRERLIPIVSNLRDVVLGPLLESGEIARWSYFPRRRGHDACVDVNVFGDPAKLYGEVLEGIRDELEGLISERVLSGVSLETYDRGSHMCGGPKGVSLSEVVAWIGSEIAIPLSASGASDAQLSDADELLTLIVRSLAQFLEGSGLELAEQIQAVKDAFSYCPRGEDGESARTQGGHLYRKIAKDLAREDDEAPTVASRLEDLRQVFSDLRTEIEAGNVTLSLPAFVARNLHDQCVRLTTDWPRVPHIERLAYEILERHLKSKMARSRKS